MYGSSKAQYNILNLSVSRTMTKIEKNIHDFRDFLYSINMLTPFKVFR